MLRLTLSQKRMLGWQLLVSSICKFAGMNPVMLNKYLFPQMKREEAKMDLQWEADQTARLEQERKDGAYADLLTGKQQGNLGSRCMDLLNNKAGDFGGDLGARKAVKELIETGIKNGVFTLEDVQQMMGYKFTNRSGEILGLVSSLLETLVVLSN